MGVRNGAASSNTSPEVPAYVRFRVAEEGFKALTQPNQPEGAG